MNTIDIIVVFAAYHLNISGDPHQGRPAIVTMLIRDMVNVYRRIMSNVSAKWVHILLKDTENVRRVAYLTRFLRQANSFWITIFRSRKFVITILTWK
jgi:hypothetical protein